MDSEALVSLARTGIKVTPHKKDLLYSLWLKICAHEKEGKVWRARAAVTDSNQTLWLSLGVDRTISIDP